MSNTDPGSLLTGVRSGQWLDEQDFPELNYTVPAIIPEGTTVFAGAPKVGKSWAVLHIGLCVAAGYDVFGCLPVGPVRPVLYLALEDGWRRLQSRARSLLGPGPPIPGGLDVLIDLPFGLAAETIAEWFDEHGADRPLVIVDTLGRVMPRSLAGESAYERDYRAVGLFKRIIDAHPGSSMVLVHHTRKLGSEDFVDGVSGTLGITGAADTTVVLSRARSDTGGILKVTGRDVFESEYAVTKGDNGRWVLAGGSLDAARKAAVTDKATVGLGDRSADIIRIVAESDGIGPTAVGQKIGIPTTAAGTYLSRLVEAGRISKSGRGVYHPVEAQIHSLHSLNGGRSEPQQHPSPRGVETVKCVDIAGQTDGFAPLPSAPSVDTGGKRPSVPRLPHALSTSERNPVSTNPQLDEEVEETDSRKLAARVPRSALHATPDDTIPDDGRSVARQIGRDALDRHAPRSPR